MIKRPALPTLLRSAPTLWRGVPRFWGVSVALGLLLAATAAPLMALSPAAALAPGVAAALLAVGALAAALGWRRWLAARRFDNAARTAIYRAHGRRFFLWFAGLGLVVVAAASLAAPLAIRLFGQTPLVLAAGAAWLACAVYCLRGLCLRPPLALGICWLATPPDDLPDYWARGNATLLLSRRYDAAIDQNFPRFRGLALAFDGDISRWNEAIETEWETELPARLALGELGRRARALAVPFAVTLALGWLVFAVVQQPLDALTFRAREMAAQAVAEQGGAEQSETQPQEEGQTDQEDTTDSNGSTPDPQGSPDPNGGGGAGTPDPQGSPDPQGGGGAGTPDPQGSPDPNGGGGAGTPDPQGSPDPNGGGGAGTPDPQGSPDPNGGGGAGTPDPQGSPDPNGGGGAGTPDPQGTPDPNGGGGTGTPDPQGTPDLNGGGGAGTPDPQGTPDPNGGGGAGTPDPQGTPDPNGGGGTGTPDPQGSPDPNGGGGAGTPDPQSSPDPNGGRGTGTPDPQGPSGSGPGPATEGDPLQGNTPPQTQAPGRIPVPQGGGRRIELEIPSLQAVGESAAAAERNAAELSSYRLPAGHRPPPAQPSPARRPGRAVQYVPNWILALSQRR